MRDPARPYITRPGDAEGYPPRPLTVVGLLRLLLAATLFAAAGAKLAAGARARDALRSYGIADPRARASLWALTIVTEAGLALAVALQVPGAAAGAAALLGLFAVALVVAMARGRAGAPCGCFGGRSRIGPGAVVRTALLGAAFAALPFVPNARPSTETWLGIGLAVALGAVASLGVGLVALAREVGELRLAIAPQAALSIAEEGPELGSHVRVIDRFSRDAPLAVAVFTSPGCALCRALEPSLRLIASDPEVELEVFDEESDPAAWDELAVPGSPYAVVLSADGEVLSKGTFNSLYQLESLLVAATKPVSA